MEGEASPDAWLVFAKASVAGGWGVPVPRDAEWSSAPSLSPPDYASLPCGCS